MRWLAPFLLALPLLASIEGCSSSTQLTPVTSPTSTGSQLGSGAPGGGAASSFYVMANGNSNVLFFAAGASGNVAPTATLSSISTAIALDPYNGGVVVARSDGASFYPQQLTAAISSLGTLGYIGLTDAVAEDTNQQVYFAGNLPRGSGDLLAGPGIAIFPSGASAPSATIQGYNTAFPYDYQFYPCVNAVAVDPAQNIYVTTSSLMGCPDSIAVYAKGMTGNVAATATIFGSNTGLSTVSGVAIGPAGIYVSNLQANRITIYPLNASGDVAPTTTISGSNTMLDYPSAVSVDSAGNIYVLNDDIALGVVNNYGGNMYVTIYASGSSGNVAPTVTIGGNATQLSSIGGVTGQEGIAVTDSILVPQSGRVRRQRAP